MATTVTHLNGLPLFTGDTRPDDRAALFERAEALREAADIFRAARSLEAARLGLSAVAERTAGAIWAASR